MARGKAAEAPLNVVDSDGNPVAHEEAPDGRVVVFDTEENDPIVKAAQELGASGDQGRVEIWRVRRTLAGAQEAFVSALALEEFSIQEVQRRFGGGEFRIKIRTEKGRIFKQDTKVIEGEPIQPKPPAPPQVIHAPASSDDGIMRAFGEIMRQNQELILTIRNQQAQPPPPQKTTLEFAHELAAIKSLFVDSSPRGDPFQMLTQTISLIKETGILEGGGGGSATTEMDLFKTLIEKFGPAFMEGMKRDNPETAAPAIPFAPNAGLAPQAAPPPFPNPQQRTNPNPPTQENREMQQLKRALHFLCAKAKSNADPDLWADVVIDEAGEEEIKALILDNAQWFDQLASIVPDVRNHIEWFTKLRASIQQALTEDQNSGNPPGDETPPE